MRIDAIESPKMALKKLSLHFFVPSFLENEYHLRKIDLYIAWPYTANADAVAAAATIAAAAAAATSAVAATACSAIAVAVPSAAAATIVAALKKLKKIVYLFC